MIPDPADPLFAGLVLVFLRVGAAMALLPALGETTVPVRVRLVLALALTAVVHPAVQPAIPAAPLLHQAGAEVVAGLALGAGLRLLVQALQMAGAMAAQAMSLSQLFASAGAEPQPTLSTLFTLAALALAAQSGLATDAARWLILSYGWWPAGTFLPGAPSWALDRLVEVTGLAFSLAAPFVIAAMVWNLALGLMNRAMPQMMVTFLGAPALGLGSLVLMALATPTLLEVWQDALRRAMAAP